MLLAAECWKEFATRGVYKNYARIDGFVDGFRFRACCGHILQGLLGGLPTFACRAAAYSLREGPLRMVGKSDRSPKGTWPSGPP